jgi:hypothetical protein
VGFREAKSDILVYVDDDIEAFPTMLEAINDAFKRDDVALVGGKCIPKFESKPPPWLKAMWRPDAQGNGILSALSLIDLGDQPKEINPLFVFGCNFSIRRRVLLEARGFHPDSMPNEFIRYRGDGETYVSNFVGSKGYKVLYVPSASIYHWVPTTRMTTDYFCQRAFNQGMSDSYSAIRKNSGIDFGSGTTIDDQLEAANWSRPPFVERISHRGGKILDSIRGLLLRSADKKRDKKIADAYQKGYEFHQRAAKDDETLRSWILRANYWNCEISSSIDYFPVYNGLFQGSIRE